MTISPIAFGLSTVAARGFPDRVLATATTSDGCIPHSCFGLEWEIVYLNAVSSALKTWKGLLLQAAVAPRKL
jgi:hypothetical protein